MQEFIQLIAKHDLIVAFLVVGIVMYVSFWFSKKILRGKIPGAAIAITVGLIMVFRNGIVGRINDA